MPTNYSKLNHQRQELDTICRKLVHYDPCLRVTFAERGLIVLVFRSERAKMSGIRKTASTARTNRMQMRRFYELHRLLRSGLYLNADELAKRLEVSSRTVKRDLECMQDQLGAPIEYSHHQRGYHYTSEYSLPPLRLTEGELVALFFGQRLMVQLAGTPFEGPVRSAFDKITAMLPATVSIDNELLEKEVSFDLQPLRGDQIRVAQVYMAFIQSMEQGYSLEVIYYTASRDATTTRVLDPYHLRYHQSVWYAVAFCHLRGEVRTFALDRVQSWSISKETFSVPADFSIEEYLGHSLGIERGNEKHRVVARFDREQARWIRERVWHTSQQLEELPEGGVILTMEVNGLGEVKRWLMGFGAHCEVLEPTELRAAMAVEARSLDILYN